MKIRLWAPLPGPFVLTNGSKRARKPLDSDEWNGVKVVAGLFVIGALVVAGPIGWAILALIVVGLIALGVHLSKQAEQEDSV